MSLQQTTKHYIDCVTERYDVLKYVYNSDVDSFVPYETPIYYSGPYWGKEELVAIVETALSGKWITSGESVRKFERHFSKKFEQKYSVMVNSGSSANLVLLGAVKKHFGWKDDDEIIVSVVGFPTTLAPILQNNLKPVFVDIELDTLNFDLELIEPRITKKTKAIFLSPVLGNPPNMDRLLEICETHGVELILDNCDSLGSTWRGKFLNEYAVASSCSFYPAHHISTGEGGMVSSNVEAIVRNARSLAWWGRDCYCVGSANLLPCGTCRARFDKWLPGYDGIVDHKYVFTNVGYNLKPLDLQGAVGLVQLNKFDDIAARRETSKNRLHELLEQKIDGVTVVDQMPLAKACWFGTPVVCVDSETKQSLVCYLEENKVQTRNYFAGNILLHPAFEHLDNHQKYSKSNDVLERVFFIGAAPHYHEAIFQYIADLLDQWSYREGRHRVIKPNVIDAQYEHVAQQGW